MPTTHARLSPSGAHRWMTCAGSIVLEDGLEDKPSRYAAEGTVAHEIASRVLSSHGDAQTYVGETVKADGFTFEVTPDMAAHINDYAKLVREYAEGGNMLVEQRVNFSDTIGVPESYGTADAIIMHPGRITVVDLKYGQGVKVDATDNKQLLLYACGVVEEFSVLSDVHEIAVVIHQPRLNHVSEYVVSAFELKQFAIRARNAADKVRDAIRDELRNNWEQKYLTPGESQCRFCRAKATCPALRGAVDKVVDLAAPGDFSDLVETDDDTLSRAMSRVEMVELWCKSIREEVERRLTSGVEVRGWKLVEGRKGNRAWTSDSEAEAVLKSFRLRNDEMYEQKLISPTRAEKLLKTSPKRWDKLNSLITRSDGKPVVAPATDRRPEVVVTTAADGLRDLA